MSDHHLKRALRESLTEERLAGARWVIQQLRERGNTRPLGSPERLELFRALNAIQGSFDLLRREAEEGYPSRGL